MNHLKRSLPTVSRLQLAALAVAVVPGIAACGGGQQSQGAPQIAASTPQERAEIYGAENAQPGGPAPGVKPAPEMDTAAAQNASSSSVAPGATPQGSSTPLASTSGTNDRRSADQGVAADSSDPSALNDAQVAAVLHALNTGEIQAAELAQKKASSADVKRFAADMITQHRDMDKEGNALFSRLHIIPTGSTVDNQLKTEGQSEVSTLQGERGKDFDRDYVDAQVRDHQHALDLVGKMIGNVSNSELKTELQNARAKIEAHLERAQKLQQALH